MSSAMLGSSAVSPADTVVQGNLLVKGGITAASSIAPSANITGDLTVGGTSTLTGAVSCGSSLAVAGAAAVVGAVTGGSAAFVGAVTAASATVSGNVNAGTLTSQGVATVSGAVNCASVSASGAVSSGSVATVGNSSTNLIVSGSPISIAGYDAITNTNVSAPVTAFKAYQPIAVPACAAGATFESPELNTLIQANGAQIIAFSICSPYTFPDGANQQGAASAIWITDSRSGNSGGFVAPQVVAARAQGWGYAITGNGTSGNPVRAVFTTSTQTNAGVLTITKIC